MTITLAPGLPPILPTLDKALDETLRSDKPDPGASDRPASLRRLALEGIARTDANDRNPPALSRMLLPDVVHCGCHDGDCGGSV